MGWNPKKEAEKAAKRAAESIVKKTLEPAGRRLKNEVEHTGDSIKRNVRDTSKNAIKDIDKSVDRGQKQLRDLSNDLEDALEQKLPDAIRDVYGDALDALEDMIEDAAGALAHALTKEGLKEFKTLVAEVDEWMTNLRENKPNLIEEIDNQEIYFELGPLTLTWSNFYSRTNDIVYVLDTYINNPPELRRKPILKFIEAISPTTIDAGVSIQAAFVVATSKELSVGMGLSEIRLALFLELGDLIMEELGIPE